MANQIAYDYRLARDLRPHLQQCDNLLLGKMVKQLGGKNEIEGRRCEGWRHGVAAHNPNPAAPKIPLFSPLEMGDICECRRNLDGDRFRLEANDIGVHVFTASPLDNPHRNIAAARTDIEQIKATNFLFFDEPP